MACPNPPCGAAGRVARLAGVTTGNAAIQVVNTTPGLIEGLRPQVVARRKPGPGEVEIRVRATGLNFRDVLMAMGMYPGESAPLGIDCSGTVENTGQGVQGIEPGDEVIAIAPGCFSTFALADARLVARKPRSLSFEQAASIPSVFLTADYTLNSLAAISRGDRILIHAAAGGVGMAALQLARRAGAEVFIAGSAEKRKFLFPWGSARHGLAVFRIFARDNENNRRPRGGHRFELLDGEFHPGGPFGPGAKRTVH